jgi:hypothetical protein
LGGGEKRLQDIIVSHRVALKEAKDTAAKEAREVAEREVRELNQKLIVFNCKFEEAQQKLSEVAAGLMDAENEAGDAKEFLSSKTAT